MTLPELFLSPWSAVAIVGLVVVLAFLINQFARDKRHHLRRIVGFCAVFLAAWIVAFALRHMGLAAAEQTLALIARMCALFTIVSAAGIIIFDLLLPAVRVRLAPIVTDLAVGAAYVVAAFASMRHAGVDLSGIITTSAVATGILALSLQSTLGNVIGGLALQADKSICVGDWVQLENGRQGCVREIRWRHTVIETRDWDTLIVPNAALLGAQVLILGKRTGEPLQHRMWVYFNVDFRFPPSDVIQAVEAALANAPIAGVAASPKPNCVCLDFARDHRNSFAFYAVRYWLTDLARDDPTSSKVRERIYAALDRADIPLAIPAEKIFVEQDSDQERTRKRERELKRRCEALEKVEIFEPLRPEEIAIVAERLVPAPFAAGETITKQGANAHWLYLIASGSVEVRVESNGVEKTVAQIDAPGFFGEQGLMTGEPRRATVVAKTKVDCYRLDKEGFRRIITERPEIATDISEILAARSVGLQAALDHLDPVSQRNRIRDTRSEVLSSIERFFGLRDDKPS
jgi:small-conductance mechanosensitive channel/CRP-like cAMP-binding protein